MAQEYEWDDFLTACKEKRVWIDKPAQKDARDYFSLPSKKMAIDFILNGGLNNREYICTNVYGNWPNKKTAPMIDSYKFTNGEKEGYVAFYKNPNNGKFIIKSFKKEKHSSNKELTHSLGKVLEEALNNKVKIDKKIEPKEKHNG